MGARGEEAYGRISGTLKETAEMETKYNIKNVLMKSKNVNPLILRFKLIQFFTEKFSRIENQRKRLLIC